MVLGLADLTEPQPPVDPTSLPYEESFVERDDRAKIMKRNRGRGNEGEDELSIRDRERAQIGELAKGQNQGANGNITAIYELCGTS